MVKKPSRDTGLKDISTSVIRCPERVTDDLWVCILSHLSLVQDCDPMDCSPPGSSVHGILQARTLEWIAISFSRAPSQPRGLNPCLLHWQADSLPLSHPGSPGGEWIHESIWLNPFTAHLKLSKHC